MSSKINPFDKLRINGERSRTINPFDKLRINGERSRTIKSIKAYEILDSRGRPTIKVKLSTDDGVFLASVPSGASRGKYEAKELRDKDGGVSKALKNIRDKIAPKIIGKDPTKQKEIDRLMIKLDGTKNKSRLGANAVLAVSMAVCRAGAAAKGISLWQHISKITENCSLPFKIPAPCFNLIEGGAHAKNQLDFQEFMIVPQKKSFLLNLKAGNEIYQSLKELLLKNYGKEAILLGDEGGFSLPISRTQQALYLITNASKNYPKTKIGLDCAASQFYKQGKYHLEGQALTRQSLLNFYQDLINTFPITFIEDPFAQDDWEGWRLLMSNVKCQMSNVLIIGDDLLTTNIKRIKEAQNKKACSGCIIKPNQIGTVTETLEAVKLAQSFNWKIMVSHRSGETLDDFIADFAVGIGADFIKSGAPFPKERMSKYRRLVEIEKEIKQNF